MLTIHRYSAHEQAIPIVIEGMRNSWESWEKGDSYTHLNGCDLLFNFELGINDRALCQKLIAAGRDHGKFLRQISIVVDFTAPEYFLKEFDTYKVGTTSNSTSMMHTLGKEPFSREHFSLEDLDTVEIDAYLTLANTLRDSWLAIGKRKPSRQWRAMLQITSQAWNYRRCWSGNYQVLRDMYLARRHHRLQEWRDWCAWIETLPYADLLTYEKPK